MVLIWSSRRTIKTVQNQKGARAVHNQARYARLILIGQTVYCATELMGEPFGEVAVVIDYSNCTRCWATARKPTSAPV